MLLKPACLVALLAITSLSFAQLPTIVAEGGSEKPVNWPEIKKIDAAEKNGPGFFYNDCAQGVGDGRSSSSLAAQKDKKYSAVNLTDNDPMTAWVEGKPGPGIGEWFSVTAPSVNVIYNGCQESPATWQNNGRVKQFKVYVDDVAVCFLVLKNKMGEQHFELPVDTDAKSHVFKFEIREVFKGLKFDDVGISHVDLVGCCMAGETVLTGAGESTRIDKAIVGETILMVNVDSMKCYPVEVRKISKSIHQLLFRIKTATGEILVTGDHPLYTRSGFSSIRALKKRFQLNDYSGLARNIELLRWNASAHKFEYEAIKSIETVSGLHNTYSIKALSGGTAYLANGFVTKTY
jgi:hypothetical protein